MGAEGKQNPLRELTAELRRNDCVPNKPGQRVSGALPQNFDVAIAIRLLGVLPALTSAERRVGVTILQHLNRRTGQCNPGVERLAFLTELNRSTVMAAAGALDRRNLIAKKISRNRTNRYLPNWERFRELDTAWNALLREKDPDKVGIRRARWSELASPEGCRNPTQTSLKNQKKELPRRRRMTGADRDCPSPAHAAPVAIAIEPQDLSCEHPAYVAAQRSWNRQFHDVYRSQRDAFVTISNLIDDAHVDRLTRLELKKRGSALAAIRELALQNRTGARSSAPSAESA